MTKTLKDGHCDQCTKFETLTRYRDQYLCRDCFVGDYDPRYVQQRLEQLTYGGDSRLAQLIDGERDVSAAGFRPSGRRGKK